MATIWYIFKKEYTSSQLFPLKQPHICWRLSLSSHTCQCYYLVLFMSKPLSGGLLKERTSQDSSFCAWKCYTNPQAIVSQRQQRYLTVGFLWRAPTAQSHDNGCIGQLSLHTVFPDAVQNIEGKVNVQVTKEYNTAAILRDERAS